MCKSGFNISTVPSVIISPALTSPSPLKLILRVFSSFLSNFNLTFLRLTIISGTSSTTFGIVENSCWTPSILTPVIALPGNEESNILLNELPIVITTRYNKEQLIEQLSTENDTEIAEEIKAKEKVSVSDQTIC